MRSLQSLWQLSILDNSLACGYRICLHEFLAVMSVPIQPSAANPAEVLVICAPLTAEMVTPLTEALARCGLSATVQPASAFENGEFQPIYKAAIYLMHGAEIENEEAIPKSIFSYLASEHVGAGYVFNSVLERESDPVEPAAAATATRQRRKAAAKK